LYQGFPDSDSGGVYVQPFTMIQEFFVDTLLFTEHSVFWLVLQMCNYLLASQDVRVTLSDYFVTYYVKLHCVCAVADRVSH
jgi:hypothetical protein